MSELDTPLVLEPLSEAGPGPLTWRRVQHEKRNFTLRREDRLFAGVRFEKQSGSSATADLAEGRFTFKRTGVFRVRITVRRAGAADDLATFVPTWTGGGQLTFADGRAFKWGTRSAFSTVYQWLGAEDACVWELTPVAGRVEAHLAPGPLAASEPEAPLLAAFGFYLGVLAMDELVAVTAATGG